MNTPLIMTEYWTVEEVTLFRRSVSDQPHHTMTMGPSADKPVTPYTGICLAFYSQYLALVHLRLEICRNVSANLRQGSSIFNSIKHTRGRGLIIKRT